jgi:hypothetical protein
MWTFSARVLTLIVLSFATPGAADIVREVVAAVAGIECCDGLCEDGSTDCCPATCTHCVCCAHPKAMLNSALVVLAAPAPATLAFRRVSRGAVSSGYRAPPFRPPTA